MSRAGGGQGSFPSGSGEAGDGGYGGAGDFADGDAGEEESTDYNGGNSGGGGGAAGRVRVNTKDASSVTIEGLVSPSDVTGLFTWGRLGVR